MGYIDILTIYDGNEGRCEFNNNAGKHEFSKWVTHTKQRWPIFINMEAEEWL